MLVFILMLIPVRNGSSIVPDAGGGAPALPYPSLCPGVRNTAILLYKMYIAMTVLEIVLLLLAGMQGFDALCISFGSAGYRGIRSAEFPGCAAYTALQQWIITAFVILFGVNFTFLLSSALQKSRSGLRHAGGESVSADYSGLRGTDYLEYQRHVRLLFGISAPGLLPGGKASSLPRDTPLRILTSGRSCPNISW